MSNQLKENLNKILEEKETKLLPENLKAGVTCLGVTGSLEEGIDTSDATAMTSDIVSGKTAYVNGEKIEGAIMEIPATYGVGFEPHATIDIPSINSLYVVTYNHTYETYAIRPDGNVSVYVPYTEINNAIDLTSDKLVSGNNILGIEGTAEIGMMTEEAYTAALMLTEDILKPLPTDYLLTVDSPVGPVASITFAKTLNVQNVTLLSDSATETVINATIDDVMRTFTVKSALPSGNVTTTTPDGVEVYHSYHAGTRTYAWKIGEIDSVAMYMHMATTASLINEHLALLTTDITIDFNKAFSPIMDFTVTMSGTGLISSVTFGAVLGVTGAECVWDRSDAVQVEAWFPDDTEYTRTLYFSNSSYQVNSLPNSLGTTSDGVAIRWKYMSDIDAYQYGWTVDSSRRIYLTMTCKYEQTLSHIELMINNMVVE